MDWIDNPHAAYVLAAYSVVLAALVALAVVSWYAYVRRLKEWRSVLRQNTDETDEA